MAGQSSSFVAYFVKDVPFKQFEKTLPFNMAIDKWHDMFVL